MNKMFNINDISGQNDECCAYANQFLPYVHKRLGFNKPVDVNFISDPENAKNPLGNTGYYDPNKMAITIFVDKRHIKDILRSLSHELVHHTQNCRGEFDSGGTTEPGYAQKDPHMRKMEAEAYLLGNGFLFRDWEDQLKQKKEIITMSEGYKRDKMEEGELEEGAGDSKNKWKFLGPDESTVTVLCTPDPCTKKNAKRKWEKKNKGKRLKDLPAETNENWTKQNKGRLLYEALVKKWAK